MSGWLTSGVPNLSTFTGLEQASFDTESANGVNPQTGSVTLQQIALRSLFFNNFLAAGKTMVAGTHYYSSVTLGSPELLTGIQVLVGGTGGTDLWTFSLYTSAGVLVANSLATGTTAGTAATWQRLAFTAAYQAAAGNYLIDIQSNGTAATFAAYNAPAMPLTNGSQTGTIGDLAAISAPSTTYTQNLGPIATVY